MDRRHSASVESRAAAVVFVGEDGKVVVREALVRDIQAFARLWDRNLKHQGFLEAANNGTDSV